MDDLGPGRWVLPGEEKRAGWCCLEKKNGWRKRGDPSGRGGAQRGGGGDAWRERRRPLWGGRRGGGPRGAVAKTPGVFRLVFFWEREVEVFNGGCGQVVPLAGGSLLHAFEGGTVSRGESEGGKKGLFLGGGDSTGGGNDPSEEKKNFFFGERKGKSRGHGPYIKEVHKTKKNLESRF